MSSQRGDRYLFSPFEGFHYSMIGQARAREAALCNSALDPMPRLLLLLMAEVQTNGCCPLGPDVWTDVLGVDLDKAHYMIADLANVGVINDDSTIWCLHVNGRAVQKNGRRGRSRCGNQASKGSTGGRPPVTRPARDKYPPLKLTREPFTPPGTLSCPTDAHHSEESGLS